MVDQEKLHVRIAEAVKGHAEHMETYTLPALKPGFMEGYTHALRLLKRDANFIAARALREED